MKTSMFLSLPLLMWLSIPVLETQEENRKAYPVASPSYHADYADANVSDVSATAATSLKVVSPGKASVSKNDPITNAIIFEYCYKQCGDPRDVVNGPCWFHCRYRFFLLGKRPGK
ncbi:MAG: hypothetical protein IPM34_10625 [Saprospiraceae bacterium]|nr:hypothetical protein [Saprospiraceae bacterium]